MKTRVSAFLLLLVCFQLAAVEQPWSSYQPMIGYASLDRPNVVTFIYRNDGLLPLPETFLVNVTGTVVPVVSDPWIKATLNGSGSYAVLSISLEPSLLPKSPGLYKETVSFMQGNKLLSTWNVLLSLFDKPAVISPPPNPTISFMVPYYTVAAGWTSQLFMVNDNASAANVRLSMYDQSGNLVESRWDLRIEPYGTMIQSIGSGLARTGYIIGQSTQPLKGYLTLEQGNNGSPRQTVIPFGSLVSKMLFPFNGFGNLPGIVLTNPDAALGVSLQLTVRDTGGRVIVSTPIYLSPKWSSSFLLSDLVPSVKQMAGSVEITAGGPSYWTTQKFTGAVLQFNQASVSSLPAN